MPLRHVISLLLLIVAPLVLIGWFGATMVARQQRQQREQLESVFIERLTDLDRDIQRIASGYEQQVVSELRNADRDTEALASIRRQQPVVRSTLLVDRDGRLIYPARPTMDDTASMAWYAALSELARNRPVGGEVETSRSQSKFTLSSKSADLPIRQQPRWQTWFHEGGLQLVLWLPRSDRTATGIVVERGRWMADLIDALPDSTTIASSSSVRGTYQLRDGAGRVVYCWGGKEDDANEPLVSMRLSSPWNAWHLSYVDDVAGMTSFWTSGVFPLLASLVAIAVALLLLGAYVMTSMRRQMSLASQRVSFASHVSHELRTPLTNIRLYAELAKRDLIAHKFGDPIIKRLDVIEEESQRLSRIVTGVLDMVSGKGKLHPIRRRPDDVVRHVLAGFQPSLESLALPVHTELAADNAIGLDEDVIELILVNLLSNVEKYAAGSGAIRIVSSQLNDVVSIDVRDHGAGISRADAKRIFEPFQRLDDSLSAPSGTGLGLAIARNAARRHGGDLILVSGNGGAHFRLTFTDAGILGSKKASS